MRHLLIGSVINILIFTLPIWQVWAITDPHSVPNNKYGIHIIDENDLENAAKLVNSSGGDWGYITMVVREDDRNIDKWRNIFVRLNQLHLIPLLRLATRIEKDQWTRPSKDQIQQWKDFLNQLPWPIKNRYVILFNEPNHAKEWGGSIDPFHYAEILQTYSSSLKNSTSDYFILPAGLDASAPDSRETMDEQTFLGNIISALPDFAQYIDGWTSHSYPNPSFMGNVNAQGKGSIRSYVWELNFLRKKGIDKILPVFITETGWPHQINTNYGKYFFDENQVATYIQIAAETVWNDPQIVAITPFILNYQSFPFDHFSWQKRGSQEFYNHYYVYQSLAKISGQPEIVTIEKLLSRSILGLQYGRQDHTIAKYDSDSIISVLVAKSVTLLMYLTRFLSPST